VGIILAMRALMRSTLRYVLASSLALAYPLAAGCSQQEFPPMDTGVGGASTTGGVGGFFDGPVSVSIGSGVVMPPGVWTKRYGDAEDQKAGAMAVNEAGDIVLTGSARGTIDFGNIPWTGTTTDNDVFIAKLSREGQSQWSRRYGDSCDQNGTAAAHTPTGEVFIAGDFCGKMDFGDTTLEAPAGERDIFVALIDDIGEDVYSRRLGGAGPQYARAATVDLKGNAILVGSFEKAFDDGSGPVTSAGMDDAFVIKLDPVGKVLWSQRLGGPGADIAVAVAVDNDGNIIVGGSFGGSVDFGGGPIDAAPGHSSAFVLALDPNGKHLWSRSFTADDESVVNGLAVSPAGLIAVAGSFAGSADFGHGLEASAGDDDAFITLLHSDGTLSWSYTNGGPQSQIGNAVAFGVDGEVALSILSQDPLEFGVSGMYPPSSSTSPGLLYLVRFSNTGDEYAVRAFASSAGLESVGVGFDQKLGLVTAGSFQKTLDHGFGAFDSLGGWDVFVSRTD
jgi:hypothetical protein